MVQNKLSRQALSLVYPIVKNKEYKKCSLTYFGKSTGIIRKDLNYNISFTTGNTLGKHIRK